MSRPRPRIFGFGISRDVMRAWMVEQKPVSLQIVHIFLDVEEVFGRFLKNDRWGVRP